jgi:prepilin-type processing-associated H-X9-DG protein
MRRAVRVGVLVAMCLLGGGLVTVAVTRAREEASRTKCSNNLKQLGLALHNYRDNHGHFPSATLPNETLYPEKRLSWLVDTFLYIEQMRLLINRTQAWDAEENLEPKGRGVDDEDPPFVLGDCVLFLCPRNSRRGLPGRPGLTHYVGIAGVGKDAAAGSLGYPSVGLTQPGVGVFGYDRQASRKEVTDGESTTMMVAETALDNGPWTAGGWPTVRGLDRGNLPYFGEGRQFGGTHRGGGMVLFVDGSVRFIKESVDSRTFEALSTIAGGEKVGTLDAE